MTEQAPDSVGDGGVVSVDTVELERVRRLLRRWWFPLTLGLSFVLFFLTSALGSGFLGVNPGADVGETIDLICPGPDACYYVTTGQDLVDRGFVPADHYWIWNIWPPGTSVTAALFIAVSKTGIPLPVAAAGVMIVAWVAVLTKWKDVLDRSIGRAPALVAVLAVGWGQIMRGWHMGNGLFYMESAATVCLLASVLLLVHSTTFDPGPFSLRRRFAFGAMSGAFLAGAAYLRTPFEVAGLLLTGVVAVLLPFSMAKAAYRRRSGSAWWHQGLAAPAPLLGVVATFHVLTVPWRLYASRRIRRGELRWSQVSDLGWRQVWMPSDHMDSIGAHWLVEATRNTPCRVDPSLCQEIYRSEIATGNPYTGAGRSTTEFKDLAVEALLHNPLQWAWIKIEAFPRYWFAGARSVDRYEVIENSLLLICLVVVLVLGYRRLGPTVFTAFVALVLATFGPVFIFHYEARYFFPLKSLLPLLTAICLFRARSAVPSHHRDEPTTAIASHDLEQTAALEHHTLEVAAPPDTA